MRPARRTIGAVVAVAVLTAWGVVAAGVAPVSAAPPVTTDDQLELYPSMRARVDVLANDTDPDGGGDLGLCRVAPGPDDAAYEAWVDGDRLVIELLPFASGEIAITYYACDYETLVPGTVTVTVKAFKPVRVVKAQRPGRVRVTNTNDRRIRFWWGNFFIEEVDGVVPVDAHETVVVRVRRTRIHWVATFRYWIDVDQGTVAGIEQP